MFLRPKKKINFVKEVLEEDKKEMRRIEVSEGLKKKCFANHRDLQKKNVGRQFYS